MMTPEEMRKFYDEDMMEVKPRLDIYFGEYKWQEWQPHIKNDRQCRCLKTHMPKKVPTTILSWNIKQGKYVLNQSNIRQRWDYLFRTGKRNRYWDIRIIAVANYYDKNDLHTLNN